MGSGKSTVGKKLAKKLKLSFVDMDEYIETYCKKTVAEIFEQEGEDKFREVENTCLKSLINEKDVVISTGGGTPCFYNNMELMNSNGVTVYLKMSVEGLVSRLIKAKNKRPLIKDMSESDLKVFVATNLENREPYYSQAQYKVKAKDLDLDELVDFIKGK